MTTVLVTGAAGFIGFHCAQRLLAEGNDVVGVDCMSPYYDVTLKKDRLGNLLSQDRFRFHGFDLANREATAELFAANRFDRVLHLAAQAGVRYSLQNPGAYLEANIIAFGNVLEGCRLTSVPHLVYASSSSVYGANTRLPFRTADNVDHPVSLYAATKKANELMAHSYSHLFKLPTTGLRFFTVYGPWGRPDMAMFIFTRAILEERPITLYNNGRMSRDFTFVDDITEGVVRVLDSIPTGIANGLDSPSTSTAPYRLYNIGNHSPVDLMRLVAVLEDVIGKRAIVEFAPMQPGDVPATFADVEDLSADVGFEPSTPIENGVAQFVRWFRDYYRL